MKSACPFLKERKKIIKKGKYVNFDIKIMSFSSSKDRLRLKGKATCNSQVTYVQEKPENQLKETKT